MNDWELRNLGWEDPINYSLIYEPFIVTNKMKQQGFQYNHPMIGNLEDEFKDGTTEVYIDHQPQWGPNWMQIRKQVMHNIWDLARWTEESMEFQTDYC
jgi:hypothetical protein